MSNFPMPKNLLPLKLHGGFSNYNRDSLAKIFEYQNIKTAIEIGSWLGKSSSFIAKHVERLYCVDIWELQPEQDQGQWKENGDNLYEQFLSNIIHLDLTEKIIPIKSSSEDAQIEEKVDLVFIDGSHTYENVKFDILKWNANLKDGGILCGDDWGIPISDISEGVVKAVLECADLLNKKLTAYETFWKLE